MLCVLSDNGGSIINESCTKRGHFFAFTRAINVFKTEYKLNENINLFQKNGFESLVLNCI